MKPKIILSVPFLAHAMDLGIIKLQPQDRIIVPSTRQILMMGSMVAAMNDYPGAKQWPKIIQQHGDLFRLFPANFIGGPEQFASKEDQGNYTFQAMVTNLALELGVNAHDVAQLLIWADYCPFKDDTQQWIKVTTHFSLPKYRRNLDLRDCDNFEFFPNVDHMTAMGLRKTTTVTTPQQIGKTAMMNLKLLTAQYEVEWDQHLHMLAKKRKPNERNIQIPRTMAPRNYQRRR